MNVWILTVGSSDIQLKADGKKRWTSLRGNVFNQLDRRGFYPSEGVENRFQVPARVLGIVYSQPQAEQHFDDLIFPLLDNFINKIKEDSIEINKVILVLSDQPNFSPSDRSSQSHPYWQDTCTLRPLIERYLKQELKEDSLEIEFLLLRSASVAEGLDDWNAVLKLVQSEFASLDFPDDSTIYVSHQAGTPAISSALQFTSLSQLGQQVKFLVSSERDSRLTRFLPSSEYLKAIRKKEAEALLKAHNYSGVEALLKGYLGDSDRIKTLLKAAIKWNVANFDEFLGELVGHPSFSSEVADRNKKENWWWIAYEEVYLAIVRKNQGNIVEAFFHSFRAFEGIFAAWGHNFFNQHIENNKDGVPCLSYSILEDSETYFSRISTKKARKSSNEIVDGLKKLKIKAENHEEKANEQDNIKPIELNLSTLCKLFRSFRYNDYAQNCKELKIFWDEDKSKRVGNKRNFIVHQVQGMSKEDLWSFWGVDSWEECEKRLLKLLNFIVKEDFPEGFESLEAASLMAKVHRELDYAIAAL